ncbi:MAG: multicopper oxidase domain-containing protein, partial [Candidatus Baltobacteraceae bacterium]
MPNRVMVVRDSHLNGGLKPDLRNATLQRATIPDFSDLWRQIGAASFVGNDGRTYPFQKPAPCPGSGLQTNQNSKELSVNGIRLPLTPIRIEGVPETTIPAGETQFWRLANTASDTVLDLEIFQGGNVVPMQVVSRDGVPLVQKNGHPTWQAVPMSHVIIAPAGRVEFYLTGTAPGSRFIIRTMKFDAGCLGDAEYTRDLIVVHVKPAKRLTPVRVPPSMDPVPARFSDLGFARPVAQRTFAFTEYPRKDSLEPDFYITQMSDPNAVETPFTMDEPPAVVVKNGTVEDWTILNYTQEIHAFHIHQIHFLVLDSAGIAYGQGQLLDTI